MSKACRVAVLLAISATYNAHAEITPAISFDFQPVDIETPDQRTLEGYLRRPGTFRCDLVRFDVPKLVALIEGVESGKIDVSDTSIELTLLGERLGFFTGIHSEVASNSSSYGPFSWGGRRDRDNVDTANFIVDRYMIATMIVNVGDVVYRTRVSTWSGNYFLCKTDGSRRDRRID